MTRFTVAWVQSVEDELIEIWLNECVQIVDHADTFRWRPLGGENALPTFIASLCVPVVHSCHITECDLWVHRTCTYRSCVEVCRAVSGRLGRWNLWWIRQNEYIS
jgi:hypothetical protein